MAPLAVSTICRQRLLKAFDWAFGCPSVASGAVALRSGAVVVGADIDALAAILLFARLPLSLSEEVLPVEANLASSIRPIIFVKLVPGYCRDVGRHHRWRDDWRGSMRR